MKKSTQARIVCIILVVAHCHVLFSQSPVVKVLEGAHTSCIRKMAFSQDGHYFASSASDKTSVWELSSGSFLTSVPVPEATFMQFSMDGKLLATIYKDDQSTQYDLAIWNLETGQDIFRQSAGPIWEATAGQVQFFAPQNHLIGVKTKSLWRAEIVLWDYISKKQVREIAVAKFGNSELETFYSLYGRGIGSNQKPYEYKSIAHSQNIGYVAISLGDSVILAKARSNDRKNLVKLYAPNTCALQFSQDTSMLALVYQTGQKEGAPVYMLSVWDIKNRKYLLNQPCGVIDADSQLKLLFSSDDAVVSILGSKPLPHEVGSWNLNTLKPLDNYIGDYLRVSMYQEIPVDFRVHPTDTLLAVRVKALYWQQPNDSLDRILIQGVRSGRVLQRILLPDKKEGFVRLQDYRFKNKGKEMVGLCCFKDGVHCLVWDLATGKELLRSPVLAYNYFAGWGADARSCWLLGEDLPNMTNLFTPRPRGQGITSLRRIEKNDDDNCPSTPWAPGKICLYRIDENRTYAYDEIGYSDTFFRQFLAGNEYLCFVKDPSKFIIYATGQ